MKIIVNKYLNARLNSPSTEEACPYYRDPGYVLEVDDIEIGTEINGNCIWYHSSDDGCFYWSGGTGLTNDLLDKRRQSKSFTRQEEMGIYSSAVNELNYSGTDGEANQITGYKGIASGYKVIEKTGLTENRICLIFYVRKKIVDPQVHVQDSINYRGFLLVTDVRVIGEIKLLQEGPDDSIPYPMGGSIASLSSDGKENARGTRSMLVQRAGKEYLLTCYHVACSILFAQHTYEFRNQKIEAIIPSKEKFPNSPTITATVIEGQFGINFDYALLEVDITKFQNFMPGHLFNNGYYTLPEIKSQFTKETILIKYGAKTGERQGKFKAYPAKVPVDDKKSLSMFGLIEVENISDKGDSGAPVVDSQNKLVGIIVAGVDSSSFIIPIAQLEFLFHFSPIL